MEGSPPLKLFRTKPALWESHWIQEIRDTPPEYIFLSNSTEVDGLIGAGSGIRSFREMRNRRRV